MSLMKSFYARMFTGLLAIGLISAFASQANAQGFAGVSVDSAGVLRTKMISDADGSTMRQYQAAARAAQKPELAKQSKMRCVSLNRLEAAIQECIAEGRPFSEEMMNLAGLQRLQYVFYYPETKDIVVAGPAEGFFTDPTGRTRGVSSLRPTLRLEDLVVALRAYAPGVKTNVIGCSIDPTAEGLAKLNQYLKSNRPNPRDTSFFVNGMKNSLGLQVVSVTGVPANTHFAQVLVEADYRMKLIGIGLEKPAVAMASYVDLTNPAAVAQNAMQRWYFVPEYESVRVTDNDQAMELVGLGVKLIGEDEFVTLI